MSPALARCGRYVFRQLSLRGTFSVPARVSLLPSHAGRLPLAASGLLVDSVTTNGSYGSALSQTLINSYATSAGRPKANSGKAKATTKATKKRSASSATTKKASKTKKPEKTEAKKPEKKELTEEQKEARKAKELKQKIKELKAMALEPPKRLSSTAHSLALTDMLAKLRGKGEGKAPQELFKEATAAVKTLSPDELESYARTAESNKEANAAAYVDWVKSHTPLQIKQANEARKKLAKLLPESKLKYPPIHDERQVTRPRFAYIHFVKERFDSGDFKHMPVKDATTRASQEWNSLTPSEKEKYVKLQAADEERYRQEYRKVYGEEPTYTKSPAKEAATA
ncbi:hypothetical protein VTN00DRAFT_4384 [Thermoascus crustaceus]|uniref:uncharacterized protein n=1 Tax=Thermoascus crustaceus TaxID=5088 RepID=UPI0037443FDB